MEVAPFFVDFHHFLSIFTHFCRDLRTFSAIFFFGQNSLLCNITRFLHVCCQAWVAGKQDCFKECFVVEYLGLRKKLLQIDLIREMVWDKSGHVPALMLNWVGTLILELWLRDNFSTFLSGRGMTCLIWDENTIYPQQRRMKSPM